MSDANAAFQTDRPFADFELRLQETADGFAVEAVVARTDGARHGLPRDVIEGWANADDPVRAAADMSRRSLPRPSKMRSSRRASWRMTASRVRINLDGAAALVNRLPWEYVRAPGDDVPLPSIRTGLCALGRADDHGHVHAAARRTAASAGLRGRARVAG
ncbi:MAG: hypothetical protein R2851_24090 [Caldilineaceae bacterium]